MSAQLKLRFKITLSLVHDVKCPSLYLHIRMQIRTETPNALWDFRDGLRPNVTKGQNGFFLTENGAKLTRLPEAEYSQFPPRIFPPLNGPQKPPTFPIFSLVVAKEPP